MKSFLKIFFAALLALFVAGFLSIICFTAMITSISNAAMSESENSGIVEENSILKLTFKDPINDNPEVNPINAIDFSTFEIIENVSLLRTLMSIEAAKIDPKIKGIYLDPSLFAQIGLASIDEIRDALLDFKSSGKFIIAYADNFSQSAYYLSSVADEIYMNSVGIFELKGLASNITFFKGLLDKLDVEPQIIRHGKYKSAIEPFTEKEISKASRQQTEELLNSVWDNILTNIAKERKLNKKALSQAISSLELIDPKVAAKYRLIDGVKHRDEVMAMLMNRVNVEQEKELNFINLNKYSKTVSNTSSSNKIAIIYAEGSIVYGEKQDGVVTDDEIIKKFKRAKNDSSVKAIVFRINSGGGSALASELMWREIELIRKEKPVIVSFGNVAASGGYYIAAASDAILCSPTTITGSIGVFSIFFNIGNTLKNKLGITTSTVQTNKGASILSPFRSMTKSEEAIMQKQTDNFYDTFVNRVAAGRNLSYEDVDKVAQGRVWSGSQALEVGLVDGIGGLRHAILLAAEKANIANDFQYKTITTEKKGLQLFFDSMNSARAMFRSDDILLNEMAKVKSMIDVEPLQAKMPYSIEFEPSYNSLF
ncbi:MAG: signal peptide peptidase SppA [Rikenellaceae bacterium]